ncbi:MAG: hypothetical protein FWE13_01065 [Firmicutes bacterium]|nr:hypothetical protein [Bacillota bacterium]
MKTNLRTRNSTRGKLRKAIAIFLSLILIATVIMATACGETTTPGRQEPQVPASVTEAYNLINAIPQAVTMGNRTTFETAFNSAETAFNALSSAYQNQVINRARLSEALGQLTNFDKNAQADVVANLISAIPTTLTYVVHGGNNVANRTAFNAALTAAQTAYTNAATFTFRGNNYDIRARIHNSAVLASAQAQLTSFDNRLEEVAPVYEVVDVINVLVLAGEITSGNRGVFESAIASAQNAYDALATDELRSLVTNRAVIAEARVLLLTFDRTVAQNASIDVVVGHIETLADLMPFEYIAGVDQTAELEAFNLAFNTAQTAFNLLENFIFQEEAARDIRNLIAEELRQALLNAAEELRIFGIQDGSIVGVVIGLIDDVIALGGVTTANRDEFFAKLDLAQDAFDELDEVLQGYVANAYRLVLLTTNLIDFDRTTYIANRVAFVEYLIAEIEIPEYLVIGSSRENFMLAVGTALMAFRQLETLDFRGEIHDVRSQVEEALLQKILYADNMLAVFDGATAIISAVNAVSNISNITLNYLEYGFLVNSIAVMMAREVLDSLTAEQEAILLEGQLEALETIMQNAEQRVAYLFENHAHLRIPQLGEIALDSNTISWQAIVVAVDYTVSYDFISYLGNQYSDSGSQEVTTNQFTITRNNGFVTNVRVVANFEEGSVFESVIRESYLTTALSITPTEHKIKTFLISDLGLNEAFRELAENNTIGSNRNEIMAFLVDSAILELENHRYVETNQVGVSAVGATPVQMNLNVGGRMAVNRDANGNVINAYNRTVAFATGSGIGSGTAVERASRADRIFFNASTNSISRHSLRSQASQNQMVTNAQLQVRWGHGQRNTRDSLNLDTWLNNYTLSPYGLFNYIVTSETISNAESQIFSMFNGQQGASGDVSNRRENITVDRQRVTIDANNNFVFSMILNARSAGARNVHSIVRAGGLSGGASYRDGDYIALEFVICSYTLEIREYTTTTRYTAYDIVNADTRVRTRVVFTYDDENRDLPWMGEHDATNEKATTSNPVSCVVKGTLITMADGTTQKVETVRVGDMIKVWNFNTGDFDVAPVMFIDHGGLDYYEAVELTFSDGTQVTMVYRHSFFSITEGRHIMITPYNAYEFIGHEFKHHDANLNSKAIELVDIRVFVYQTETFNLITPVHLTFFANGVLTAASMFNRLGFLSIFEVDIYSMAFCVDAKNELVAEFGLMSFEEFQTISPTTPPELFFALNGQYVTIALATGAMTIEGVFELIDSFQHFLV